jgi:Aminoglycoside phosphotransferase
VVGDSDIEVVWTNEVGGRTFRVGVDRFLKWSPHAAGIDLRRESARLRWAARYTSVPFVLDEGADESGQWLLTRALLGESAVAPVWIAEPQRAVVAIGRGLRALHDGLPVADCPFDWSVASRLARACFDERAWHPEHRQLSPAEVQTRLASPPPIDQSVVCHGDACTPNTLIDSDGSCSGHVDLGALGVADRWADLAVATWSTQWNYGPDWEDALLDAYGIAPDAERTAYYRLLWEVTP